MAVEPLDEEEVEFARSLATRGRREGGSVSEGRCFLEREGNTRDFLWTRPAVGADAGASGLSLRLEARTEAILRIGGGGGDGRGGGCSQSCITNGTDNMVSS